MWERGFEWEGGWGGGVGGLPEPNTLRQEGGVAHAFCAACLVILWHHLSASKLSSGDVSPHLSCVTVANFPFGVRAHICCRECVSVYPPNLISIKFNATVQACA